ncbi:MAG: hypothetical protein ACREC9_14320 [Methylocella sp.]
MAISHGEGDLIAAIYDAIIDPSRWDEVVKRTVEATKSVAGGLFIRLADAADISAVCNADPFYVDAFVQHYYKINPFNASGAAIAPGEVRAATSITQTDSFKASAYYMNSCCRRDGPMSSALVFFARPKRSDFCPSRDRPARFGWNLPNGNSWKFSRRI